MSNCPFETQMCSRYCGFASGTGLLEGCPLSQTYSEMKGLKEVIKGLKDEVAALKNQITSLDHKIKKL